MSEPFMEDCLRCLDSYFLSVIGVSVAPVAFAAENLGFLVPLHS